MKVTVATQVTITREDGSTVVASPAPVTREYDLAADQGVYQGEMVPVVRDALDRSATDAIDLLLNAVGRPNDSSRDPFPASA